MTESLEADVCVIGSGPAGSMVAWEATRRGQTVIVLERGDYHPASTQALGRSTFGWDSRTEVAPFAHARGETIPLMPTLVGGAAEIYGGAAHRMLPDDFRMRTVRGEYPGADVTDWPWSYDELEPYYAEVEELIGVSGTTVGTRNVLPRSTAFPQPALDAGSELVQRLDAAAASLGLHSQPTPVALLGAGRDGRSACVRCGFCAGLPCLYGAKASPTQTTLRHALATGRCRVIPRVAAHRIVVDDRRAQYAVVSDHLGGTFRVGARWFAIAGGAIESARLLQLSQSPKFPSGLGNHASLLGAYFCSHATPRTAATFDREMFPANTHFAVRSIDDLYFVPPPLWKGGLLQLHTTGGMHEILAKDATAQFSRPGQVPLRHPIGRRATMFFIGDVLPQRQNRVTLSRMLDRFGYPRPRVEFTFHPADVTSGGLAVATASKILGAMGASQIVEDTGWVNSWHVGYHFSGTCRAGRDPATSVVDPFGRVHDCSNVFVCDSAVFPTSGGVNPALTIQASALRIARHAEAM